MIMKERQFYLREWTRAFYFISLQKQAWFHRTNRIISYLQTRAMRETQYRPFLHKVRILMFPFPSLAEGKPLFV